MARPIVGDLIPFLKLGETLTTAYRGDRGKTAYDHAALTNNPHTVDKTQVGLSNVTNDKQATESALTTHTGSTANPHTVTKAQVGLTSVTNNAQLPIAGGTMTGILYPQNNTSYTTGQARRIILSTGNPSGGGNGDVWLKYE